MNKRTILQVWKERAIVFWKGWGLSILIALLIATSFKSAIADWNDIPSGSMKPTILEGDRIFVNKLAYDLKVPYTTWHLATWAHPARGDIVVFYSPHDEERLIKRVVGLPGDTIAMYNNRLWLNGRFLEYEFDGNPQDTVTEPVNHRDLVVTEHLDGRKHPVMLTSRDSIAHTFMPLVVPEGYYFMMGDNRDNSADSRFFGPVERGRIVGRALAVVLSRDQSFLHPRWERFFSKLI